jgi:hypothetical protein
VQKERNKNYVWIDMDAVDVCYIHLCVPRVDKLENNMNHKMFAGLQKRIVKIKIVRVLF